MIKKLSISILLLSATMVAVAQDWPQYLGPTRDSKSPQKNLLREWPAEGPEVLWSVDVGIGYGGPVIEDGKAYLLDRDGQKEIEIMRCFDMDSGKELWRHEYPSAGNVMYPGSRSVPIVEGKYVYSAGHNGDLYCYDTKNGKVVWNKNFWTEYGGDKLPIWAISQCPLIYGDMLIVLSGAPEAGLVAYNKKNGEVIWKTPSLGDESYTSPNIVKIDGEDHLCIVISSTNPFGHRDKQPQKGKVIGLNPTNGEILWRYDNWECHISCSNATDAGDNKLLIVGGYERGATMIQVEKGADGKYATKELYTTIEFGDQTKPALFHDGYFYAQYGTNNRRDGLCCMDINGNIMWKTKREPNFDKGSMILADGLILATDGLNSLYLIQPDPTGFKPLAKADLLAPAQTGDAPQGGQMGRGMMGRSSNWAPIALSDGKLLIRNQQKMFCVKVAK